MLYSSGGACLFASHSLITSMTTALKVSVAGKRREHACRGEESFNQRRSWESNIATVFSTRSWKWIDHRDRRFVVEGHNYCSPETSKTRQSTATVFMTRPLASIPLLPLRTPLPLPRQYSHHRQQQSS